MQDELTKSPQKEEGSPCRKATEMVLLPKEYLSLNKQEKVMAEKAVLSAMNENLVNAKSVLTNNMLESAERKRRAFRYADMLEDTLCELMPQVHKYVQDQSQEEVEQEFVGEGKHGSFSSQKILRGRIRRKTIFTEQVARIAQKHADLLHSLGSAPAAVQAELKETKVKIGELHAHFGEEDPLEAWEKKKSEAIVAD